MTGDAGTLVYEGKRLCFGDEGRDLALGRKLLSDAAEMGRDDATFLLGRSFEIDGNFDQAAEFYKKGVEKRYRASVYRLAILHGRRNLSYSDRNYYLQTVKRLSKEGHHPSIARYTIERIKGAYGLFPIVIGLAAIVPNFLRGLYAAYKDPEDPLLRH
jgi:TPR repeat protein